MIAGGEVVARHGRRGVEAIDVVDAMAGRRGIACDALAVSGGCNPDVHLTCHLGGKPVWNEDIAAFTPGTQCPPGMHVAGAANGALTLGRCLTDGASGGRDGGGRFGFRSRLDCAAARRRRAGSLITPLWHVKQSRGKAFVDFQNDVTVKDIALARSRRLSRGRASEALHHARHGDRSGQDRERHRASRSSPNISAAAFPRSAPRPSGRLTCR